MFREFKLSLVHFQLNPTHRAKQHILCAHFQLIPRGRVSGQIESVSTQQHHQSHLGLEPAQSLANAIPWSSSEGKIDFSIDSFKISKTRWVELRWIRIVNGIVLNGMNRDDNGSAFFEDDFGSGQERLAEEFSVEKW